MVEREKEREERAFGESVEQNCNNILNLILLNKFFKK